MRERLTAIMRSSFVAFLAYIAVHIAVLGVAVLIAWYAFGHPLVLSGDNTAASISWLIAAIAASFSSGLLASLTSVRIDKTGETARLMRMIDVARLALGWIRFYTADRRELPPSVEIADVSLIDSWHYLNIPLWCFIAYRVASICGQTVAINYFRLLTENAE